MTTLLHNPNRNPDRNRNRLSDYESEDVTPDLYHLMRLRRTSL
jgi:hypothetical protein